MTTKAQRKRRAVIGALALLEWRDRMARENAEREKAERKVVMRYALIISEMAREASRFEVELADRGHASRVLTFAVMPVCHGTGHAGAI